MTRLSFSGVMKKISYLNISNNKISSLEMFRSSQFFPTSYSSNSSDHIFLVLDVRNNEIKTIPYWILAIQPRYTLLLSGNPIKCSCEEATQYSSFWEVSSTRIKMWHILLTIIWLMTYHNLMYPINWGCGRRGRSRVWGLSYTEKLQPQHRDCGGDTGTSRSG